MHLKLSLGMLAGMLLLGLTFGTAVAQEDFPSDDEVNEVAKGMYCPVCENVPLDVCPTQACKQWRDTIREKLALGWSHSEIEQYFVNQYGDRVLATPPASGLNWLVYLLPPAVFVIGAIVLAGAVRSWRTPQEPVVAQNQESATDPYLERVEEELRRRE